MSTMTRPDSQEVFALREETDLTFSDRETILYALAAGMGRDPLDERELRFVYEGEGFVAMPTLAAVIGHSNLTRSLPINYGLVLHGAQSLRLHRPLPTAGRLVSRTRITRVLDKGEGKGAVVMSETEATLGDEAAPLFTMTKTIIARGDGGFGGQPGPAPEAHPLPDRTPDVVHTTQTRPDQALLYRLSGDRNPLHADPALARKAGFAAPILHGLCSYAIACRAVLASVCEYDPTFIGGFDVRFTSPVLPGDRIETDIWRQGEAVSFRCRVPERNVVVLNNGFCPLTRPLP